jgi:hypothetical protein
MAAVAAVAASTAVASTNEEALTSLLFFDRLPFPLAMVVYQGARWDDSLLLLIGWVINRIGWGDCRAQANY